jgi:hypothetical protein
MISSKVIYEKSQIIPTKKTNLNKYTVTKKEYMLNNNMFDPSQSSPPNEFMIKLHMRMHKYSFQINDANCESE